MRKQDNTEVGWLDRELQEPFEEEDGYYGPGLAYSLLTRQIDNVGSTRYLLSQIAGHMDAELE